MKWRRHDDCYSQSDAGYRVSRAKHEGRWRYAAWAPCPGTYRGRPTMRWDLIGVFDEADAAAQACEQHRERSHAA